MVKPGFSISGVSVSEGNTLVFTVVLDKALTVPATVDFTTINGTALAGTHYSGSSGTLTFAPGETSRTISVLTNADSSEICAPNRVMNVQLSNPVGSVIAVSSAQGTITDPDVPSLSIDSVTGIEGAVLTFTASLSAACGSRNVTFSYSTSGTSATSGTDFLSVNTVASITAGSTSLTLPVSSIADTTYENDETFTVTLSSLVNANPGTISGTGTILNDDSIPVVTVTTASQSFSEASGNATITISLSNPSYQNVTIPYTLSGTASQGAGSDYIIAASPAVITAGATTANLTVAVNNDTISEVNETVILTIGTPVNGTKGTADTHTLTIIDNDYAKVTNVTSSATDGTYTSGNIDVSVVFSSSVDVVGTPLLNLNTTPPRFASYLSGTGTNTLIFRYPIQYGDASADLDYVSSGALALSGGTIKDSLNTTNADLTLAVPGASGSLGSNKNIVINAPAQPQINSISVPVAGNYFLGDDLNFTVVFSENVNVTGVPSLSLNIGGSSYSATYVSGSGTANLIFKYTVATNVNGTPVTLTSPLNLNGGTIKNGATMDALLTFTPPSITGVVVDGRTLTLSFTKGETLLSESNVTAKTLTLSLTAAPLVNVTIPITLSGSAVLNTDFQISSSSVVIPAGQTTANFTYNLLDDGVDELQKKIIVAADRPAQRSNIILSDLYVSTVAITDDDPVKDRWLKLAIGSGHGCGVTTSGVLKCWGGNFYGQIGDGTNVTSYAPKVIDAGTSYQEVAIGENHSCGITVAGVLKCWGANGDGQVGDGTTVAKTAPTVIDPGVTYSYVGSYFLHTCGITSAGVLKCWGDNFYTQIGDNTSTDRPSPVVIDSGVTYQSLATGGSHSCAVTTAGVMKCWGYGGFGAVGDGSTANFATPIVIDSGTNYKFVGAGNLHTCGITISDQLKCWGYNNYGQSGDGTTTPTYTPVIIDSGVTYQTVAGGTSHTCAVTTAGILKCWGRNNGGQLGNGTTTNSSSPLVIDSGVTYQTAKTGSVHSCGLTSSNMIRCWGTNSNWQMGDGIVPKVLIPFDRDPGSSYKLISSLSSSCGLTTGNAIKCWGTNSVNEIGDSTSSTRYAPVTLDPGTSYQVVDIGTTHGCGITSGNVLKCWGYNSSGQLGINTNFTQTAPVIVEAGTSYSEISVGNAYTCGITTAGVLKCWGNNSNNQLGDGTTNNSSIPLVIDAGVSYSKVAAGNRHTCAITTAGVFKCWGLNGSGGNIGDGSTSNTRATPVIIDSGVTYKAVSVDGFNSCGITTAGDLKCWGDNALGQLGINSTTPSPLPVLVDSGTSYASISVSNSNHVCGITTAGILKCWGDNAFWALGELDTTKPYRLVPDVTDPGNTYKSIAAGNQYTCGVTTTDKLRCWGRNNSGQMGDWINRFYPKTIGNY